jgi:hypothetical protein
MNIDYPTWLAGVLSALLSYVFFTIASTGTLNILVTASFLLGFSCLSAVIGELFSGYSS